MANRKRIYYPDTQINKSLFTSGEEWMLLETWEEYKGYYHSYSSTGEVFTEPDWHPTKSKPLVPFKRKSPEYFKYIDLVNYDIVNGSKTEIYGSIKLDRYTAPRAVLRKVSPIENSDGIMLRYFLVKRNEPNEKLPIEIDKKQADTYGILNHGINQYLYELVTINWKIEGPEFDILRDGIVVIPGVVSTNQRIVFAISKKFPIFGKLLTNLRQFSKYDTKL